MLLALESAIGVETYGKAAFSSEVDAFWLWNGRLLLVLESGGLPSALKLPPIGVELLALKPP